MKYTEFVQLGNEKQCKDNGLSPSGGFNWSYMFGYSNDNILANVGISRYAVRGAWGSRGTWTAHPKDRTTFKLTLILEE